MLKSRAACGNPLLVGSQPGAGKVSAFPPYASVHASHVVPGIRALLEQSKAELKSLERQVSELLPQDGRSEYAAGQLHKVQDLYKLLAASDESLGEPLHRAWRMVHHLKSVGNTDALTEAVEEVEEEVTEFDLLYGQSAVLYRSWKLLKDSADAHPEQDGSSTSASSFLEPADRRVIELSEQDMRLSGVGLQGEERARFNAMERRLTSLSTKYNTNVLKSTQRYRLVLTAKQDVENIPQTVLELAAQTCRDKKIDEAATTESGPWYFDTDDASYSEFMRYCERRDLREQMYRARVTRASEMFGAVANYEPPMEEQEQAEEGGEEQEDGEAAADIDVEDDANASAAREPAAKKQRSGSVGGGSAVARANGGSSAMFVDEGGPPENGGKRYRFDNVPILAETLTLRQEKAALLGYKTFAELSLDTKMATVAKANDLLEELRGKSMPKAAQDCQELTQFAQSQSGATAGFLPSRGADGTADGTLERWDLNFYENKQKEAVYGYKEDELKQFFALPNVLKGLFELTGKLFGIQVMEIQRRGNTADENLLQDLGVSFWHDDVRFFQVSDITSGKTLAYMFGDFYARPGVKDSGAWMDGAFDRSANDKLRQKYLPMVQRPQEGKGEGAADQEELLPIAFIVCNQNPPLLNANGDVVKPSLMDFTDVETVFHEFGHALQHMLTTQKRSQVSGCSGVEWDAVELPSQFMENWCYHKPTVDTFAFHHETKEPIPDELFRKVKAAKNFRYGSYTLSYLNKALTDMELHGSKEDFEIPVPDSDVGAPSLSSEGVTSSSAAKQNNYDFTQPTSPGAVLMERVFRRAVDVHGRTSAVLLPSRAEYKPFETRYLSTFSHAFEGEAYAAGYWSYVWAEVLSADAFAAFEEAGLDNEAALARVGRKFRDTVLSLGGGTPAGEVFHTFRGRDFRIDALLRHRDLL